MQVFIHLQLYYIDCSVSYTFSLALCRIKTLSPYRFHIYPSSSSLDNLNKAPVSYLKLALQLLDSGHPPRIYCLSQARLSEAKRTVLRHPDSRFENPKVLLCQFSKIDPFVGLEVKRQLASIPVCQILLSSKDHETHHWYSASTMTMGKPR
jgi:hypothetical protein